jgi:hypothetical protein
MDLKASSLLGKRKAGKSIGRHIGIDQAAGCGFYR